MTSGRDREGKRGGDREREGKGGEGRGGNVQADLCKIERGRDVLVENGEIGMAKGFVELYVVWIVSSSKALVRL